MFNTPILLIAWNRPEKVSKVINAIKKITPNKIYIACDGPIPNNELNQLKVNETRSTINKEINWKCKLKKYYRKKNYGCKIAVSDAITWFFKNETSGIILEDDCVPHIDFFYFCEEMLEKYKNDERVWCISAHNIFRGSNKIKFSYYFSKYFRCWGWATWSRCWKRYDRDIKDWPNLKKQKILENIFDTKKEINFWEKTFDGLFYKSFPNTWDYQWTYACLLNSGLTIIPRINLISNIGFDKEATHTFIGESGTNNKELNFKKSGIFPLLHPDKIYRNKKADKIVEALCYSGYPIFSFSYMKFFIKKIYFKIKLYFWL